MAVGAQGDMLARLRGNLPASWFPDQSNAPVINGLLSGTANVFAYVYSLIQYARAQARIKTASDAFLDLIAWDYLGARFTRVPGEADATFQARLLEEITRPRAARAGVFDAVEDIVGVNPRIIELGQPSDTGVYDGLPGAGACYYDVDNPLTPARYADPSLAAQFLIETPLPLIFLFNGNPPPCYDDGAFFDAAGSCFLDPVTTQLLGPGPIYAAVNYSTAAGVTAWVSVVPPPTLLSWDQPGLAWDTPGLTWDMPGIPANATGPAASDPD